MTNSLSDGKNERYRNEAFYDRTIDHLDHLHHRQQTDPFPHRLSLYAIPYRGKWKWQVTLNMQADLHWWRDRESEELSAGNILLVRNPVPIDGALHRMKLWNAHSIRVDEPNALPSSLPSLIQKLMKQGGIDRIPLHGIARGKDQRTTRNDWIGDRFVDKRYNDRIMERLSSLLQGRMLHAKEMQTLLQENNIECTSDLSYVIQWAYLSGAIQYTSGMHEQETEGRYVCRRCGGEGDELIWTSCLLCKRKCPYCQACLQMGKIRRCTLLFHGLSSSSQRCENVNVGELERLDGSSHEVHTQDASYIEELNEEEQMKEQIARLQQDWGLSDAQANASAAGIAFLQKIRGRSKLRNDDRQNGLHQNSERRNGRQRNDNRQYGLRRNNEHRIGEQRNDAHQNGKRRMSKLRLGERCNSDRLNSSTLTWMERSYLIWAVTGAGKTEMIYPLIEDELHHGGNVVIATPRKDVVLELLPRVQSHFPNENVIALYGGSPHRWQTSSLMLATTHQLLRFRHAFDLVIVDEVDAFPYHNNKMLQYAAEQACRAKGAYVFLSATPPTDMMKQAKRGRLAHVKVPARYHRHPLPVPYTLSRRSHEGRLRALVNKLHVSLARGAQCFVFVPRIDHVDRLVEQLHKRLPNYTIDGTSSVDPEREQKVKRFRTTEIRILVTTTILERGVTIPRSDVFVFDADAELFDAAALAQMAGRAGRNVNDPHGRVYFIAANLTRSQRNAIQMIRNMNRLAKKNGYLLPQYRSTYSRLSLFLNRLRDGR